MNIFIWIYGTIYITLRYIHISLYWQHHVHCTTCFSMCSWWHQSKQCIALVLTEGLTQLAHEIPCDMKVSTPAHTHTAPSMPPPRLGVCIQIQSEHHVTDVACDFQVSIPPHSHTAPSMPTPQLGDKSKMSMCNNVIWKYPHVIGPSCPNCMVEATDTWTVCAYIYTRDSSESMTGHLLVSVFCLCGSTSVTWRKEGACWRLRPECLDPMTRQVSRLGTCSNWLGGAAILPQSTAGTYFLCLCKTIIDIV